MRNTESKAIALQKELAEREAVVDALKRRHASLEKMIEEEDRKLRGVRSTLNRLNRSYNV